MKITKLALENVKRVKAVTIEPSLNGLTVIGGRNGQGKTSVLDAIAWALGGNKYAPSNAGRDGSMLAPALRVELDNGIIVERNGEKSTLKVTDPQGKKAGQALLDAFVEKLALDLPKFLSVNSKEKAKVLLQIIGVKEELAKLECEEQATYNKRHEVGRIADAKAKYASQMAVYEDVPDAPISAMELIKQQQAILLQNAKNQKTRQSFSDLTQHKTRLVNQIQLLQTELATLENDLVIAQKSAETLQDESTEALEKSILHIDELNSKIRMNLDRDKALQDADCFKQEYNALSDKLDQIRIHKTNLLQSAQMPLPDLSVSDGELIYKGKNWDCMSGSEQLMVAVAIVQKLNPHCQFVLIDQIEQMDIDTLQAFGQWLTTQGLQAICTRVSTGNECEIIIEDGEIKEQEETTRQSWTKGAF